jgi:hypothetical protein
MDVVLVLVFYSNDECPLEEIVNLGFDKALPFLRSIK